MSGRNMFLIIIWITVAVSTHRVTHPQLSRVTAAERTSPTPSQSGLFSMSSRLANSRHCWRILIFQLVLTKLTCCCCRIPETCCLPVFTDIEAADTVAADDVAACTAASREHARLGSKAWTTGHCGSCSVTYPAVWRDCSQAVSGNCHMLSLCIYKAWVVFQNDSASGSCVHYL